MTGDGIFSLREKRRIFGPASRVGVWASRMKRTSGGHIKRRRRFSGEFRGGWRFADFRRGVQQDSGIGMTRTGEHGITVADFAYLPEIHNGGAVTKVLHNGQIVGNKQVGELSGLSQVKQEVEYLGLDGDIQCGDGFIGDNKPWFNDKRAGDTNPLSLSAGELVGISFKGVFTHSGGDECLCGFLLFIGSGWKVKCESLGEHFADSHSWI